MIPNLMSWRQFAVMSLFHGDSIVASTQDVDTLLLCQFWTPNFVAHLACFLKEKEEVFSMPIFANENLRR